MNILLCSVGRRPYLVDWFKEALELNGVEGQVIAADLDPFSPAGTVADRFIEAPAVTDTEYQHWLSTVLDQHQVELAISINDFELSIWSGLPLTDSWKALIRLDADTQNLVEDKFIMSAHLRALGVPTPDTWLGTSAEELANDQERAFITKGRFGSASRGLRFPASSELVQVIDEVTAEVTDRTGVTAIYQQDYEPAELVLVQSRVDGAEYGLDVVNDLEGRFSGVIARRKLSMRAGETDRAESVDGSEFLSLARTLAEAVPHRGIMDVDVIVTREGEPYVIDVNPRFGGGYPLSHVAGANVPSAYIAWANHLVPSDSWDQVECGRVAAKYVAAMRI